jgi:hypothetical protein
MHLTSRGCFDFSEAVLAAIYRQPELAEADMTRTPCRRFHQSVGRGKPPECASPRHRAGDRSPPGERVQTHGRTKVGREGERPLELP